MHDRVTRLINLTLKIRKHLKHEAATRLLLNTEILKEERQSLHMVCQNVLDQALLQVLRHLLKELVLAKIISRIVENLDFKAVHARLNQFLLENFRLTSITYVIHKHLHVLRLLHGYLVEIDQFFIAEDLLRDIREHYYASCYRHNQVDHLDLPVRLQVNKPFEVAVANRRNSRRYRVERFEVLQMMYVWAAEGHWVSKVGVYLTLMD